MAMHVAPRGALLQGKVAVVTGGVGTVGSAVVARLVSEGVRVVAIDQGRPPDPAPVGVSYLRGDVAQAGMAARAVATAEAAFGGLDLLVNAASGSHPGGLADLDLTWWNRVLAVNLTGTLLACQAAAPAMRRHGGGVIVNFGAVEPLGGQVEQLAYLVSRDAVVALSRHLALALAPLGIRVECVRPSPHADPSGSPDKDIATEVVRLLSPAADAPPPVPARPDRPVPVV